MGKVKVLPRSVAPGYIDTDVELLVQVVVQMAAHSLAFVTERTFPALFSNTRKYPVMSLVGIKTVNWLLDTHGHRCVWRAVGSGNGIDTDFYDSNTTDEIKVNISKENDYQEIREGLLNMARNVVNTYVPSLLKVCAETIGVRSTGYASDLLQFTSFRSDLALSDSSVIREVYDQRGLRVEEFAKIYRRKHIVKKVGGEEETVELIGVCVYLFKIESRIIYFL